MAHLTEYDDRMARATEFYLSGRTLRSAARTYGLPASQLSRRVNGQQNHHEAARLLQKLTYEQERVIVVTIGPIRG